MFAHRSYLSYVCLVCVRHAPRSQGVCSELGIRPRLAEACLRRHIPKLSERECASPTAPGRVARMQAHGRGALPAFRRHHSLASGGFGGMRCGGTFLLVIHLFSYCICFGRARTQQRSKKLASMAKTRRNETKQHDASWHTIMIYPSAS